LRAEQYVNPVFISQMKAIMSEFNLALSLQHTDYLLYEAKEEFMMQIGQTTLREN